MAKLKRKTRAAEDFQMAPMIDMVFLLLVFFMCVSTLAQADKMVELELAESDTGQVPEDLSGRGIISLDASGTIYVAGEACSLEVMKERIGAALKADSDLKIQLRADRATPYLEIKKVLKACAEEGAYAVIYSTVQTRRASG